MSNDTQMKEKLTEQFIASMIGNIKFFAKGSIPDEKIKMIAIQEVARLDFENEWQMHKGFGVYYEHTDRWMKTGDKYHRFM